jgi:hypothetical protein
MREDTYQAIEWLLESGELDASIIAPGNTFNEFAVVAPMGISLTYYDIDPKFKNISNCNIVDVIFETPPLSNCIIHMNAQKTYPIGKLYNGVLIICGGDDNHPGDCNVVTSCKQLITQNNIHTVYATKHIAHRRINSYIVWGRND